MENQFTIQTEIRLARNSDLLVAPFLLRLGQPYYVLDINTKLVSGVYVIDQFTSSIELEKLHKTELIYVPVVPEDSAIQIVLQQNDLKAFQKNGHNLYKKPSKASA